MFTNNYIALKHNRFFSFKSSTAIVALAGAITPKPFVDAGGNSFNMLDYAKHDLGYTMQFPRVGVQYSGGINSSDGYSGIYFGSGYTPATKEDYRLVSVISEGMTASGGIERVVPYENGKSEVIAKYILTNTSEAEINIWEIGCFGLVPTSTSQYRLALMERTVLTEPITIPVGETKMVTYKVVFNQF